jgi:glycosyltransferase involved in cell wall biosynthesis
MKILQITPHFLPYTGGLERYVWNLSKYLTEKGHEVEIYTSNIPRTKKFEVIDGITIRRFTSIAEPLRNPIIPGLLCQDLHEIKKFDIVQVHLLYSYTALYGFLLKSFTDSPLLLTHHGRMNFNEKYRDEIVKVYEKTVFRELLKIGDRCVVLSQKDAEFIASAGMDQKLIKVIPNGIDPSDLMHLTKIEMNQFLNQYNLKNKKIILFVGRLIAVKGVDTLIKAFFRIKNKGPDPDLVLAIVGDGDQSASLKRLVDDLNLSGSVIFFGELPISETIKFYQSSSIFVLPSLSEGFSTVLLEAMFYGIPVIASDIPFIRDYFNKSAYLVPPENDEALADAIITLFKDNEMRDRLSASGKDLVKNTYTWDKIIEDYINLYNTLKKS